MNVLFIGVDQYCSSAIEKKLHGVKHAVIANSKEFEEILETPPTDTPELVLCGNTISELAPLELAQTVRGMFAKSAVFYVTTIKEGFDKKKFIKNGYNDAFLLPLDDDVLKSVIEDIISKVKQIKSYKPVKLIDIGEDSKLDFGVRVFLPQNKKYIMFSNAGETIDKERVEKLQKHNIGSVYVAREEMGKFYEYSANRLVELGKADNSSISETERKERLQGSIRNLFGNVVNLASAEATVDQGRELVADMQQIVDKYIVNNSPSDWYVKLQASMGAGGDSYSHAANVSTYAALFSIGLQMGKPEELAMAGLFHDLGLTDVPPVVLEKSEAERSPEEQALFKKHPEYSVNIMKARKLIVPQSVINAILQHHERWDGKGYPKGIHGVKICNEAKVLSLANQFDNLTRVEEGKKRLTPYEAMIQIQKDAFFEPEFMQKALQTIPKD